MLNENSKKVEYLVVDTTAFIQNAPLHEVASNIVTCADVVKEITSKRQLRRLVVLPYDLEVKEVYPENITVITEFSKKTGDYASLSATDIKVMALTYQLEKEKVGTNHLKVEPTIQKSIVTTNKSMVAVNANVAGFYFPGKVDNYVNEENELQEDIKSERDISTEDKEQILHKKLQQQFEKLDFKDGSCDLDEILPPVNVSNEDDNVDCIECSIESDNDEDDGWITPSNVKQAKKQVHAELMEEKHVTVACMTTDFAMQNVLKQMNLNIAALDGRIIKQVRTYILRCYTCFKTTSLMDKKFCPKCGNNTLKKVAVSVDENGKLQIHINTKRPLTGRGKKFSLPKIKGGKHPNNPILVADQPMPDNRPTRLARTKTNALDDDYIAGFSPFAMRDVNSKSAQLGVRPGQEFKYWMKKNPNEARRKRK